MNDDDDAPFFLPFCFFVTQRFQDDETKKEERMVMKDSRGVRQQPWILLMRRCACASFVSLSTVCGRMCGDAGSLRAARATSIHSNHTHTHFSSSCGVRVASEKNQKNIYKTKKIYMVVTM